MHRREWHTLGRAKLSWGTGPWQEEPDAVAWVDAHTALPCIAKRHEAIGHWCGYVGVPTYHIYHGRSYDAVPAAAHGGLTFSHHTVTLPEPLEGYWWFGFDCAHTEDISPGISAAHRNATHTFGEPHAYRALAYVEAECAKLADQLSRAPL